MKCLRPLLIATVLSCAACHPVWCGNLLLNPGFEDPAGWSSDWTIRDADGGNLTYFYHLTHEGGGHGEARPRSGLNALEIYSTDRRTYLVQAVDLQPGAYRLSAYARVNGSPDVSPLEMRIGDKKATVPVFSARYKKIWADFEVVSPGRQEVSLHSSSYGVALDDVSLEKLNEQSPDGTPIFHVDLYPSSEDRSANIQYCLRDSLQWVNFAVTCVAPQRIKHPIMRVMASDPVHLSGLNEGVIHGYRMRNEDVVKLHPANAVLDGTSYKGYSFPLPRFVLGDLSPLTFGGFWISNVPRRNGKVLIDILESDDSGPVLAREVIGLVTVDPPVVQKTPKRYYTFGYAVQDWRQSFEERRQAIPAQFAMMGMNVWSDYGLSSEIQKDEPTAEEAVLRQAFDKHGVRQFWPNFASMTEVAAGYVYSDVSTGHSDSDMYLVRADGSEDKRHYNFNYCANRGSAWMQSSIAAWPRTVKRLRALRMPFRYGGFVNDGLEGMHQSYDRSTLAAFAERKGVSVEDVTPEKLSGDWKRDWQLFNMDLYSRVVDIWAGELKKADPRIKAVNTASTYGPAGFDALTPREQMAWAKSVEYNMPQWYAGDYYGSAYYDNVMKGEAEGVFGSYQDGTDLIPLLNLSMGGGLADPAEFRFKMLDFFSSSRSVKGVGYYVMANGFSDARFMVGLSDAHTLLAEIEDYYADGARDDSLVSVTPLDEDRAVIPGMDADGRQAPVQPQSATAVRVHKLNRDRCVALITIITHSEQGVGGAVRLSIAKQRLPDQGRGLWLLDRLTNMKQPLPDSLTVDTSKSKNLAVFEIVQ